MKKILLLGTVLWSGVAMAQLSEQDMVAITPIISDHVELPGQAGPALENKLFQMVTQNGFGSVSGQFFLTANVVFTDKQVTATAPAMNIVEMEVSLYVINAREKLIVDEMVYTVKGVDRNEGRAIMQALNQIKTRTPKVRMFMEGVRRQIVEYHNAKMAKTTGNALDKARVMVEMEEYDAALGILKNIEPSTAESMAMIKEVQELKKAPVEAPVEVIEEILEI